MKIHEGYMIAVWDGGEYHNDKYFVTSKDAAYDYKKDHQQAMIRQHTMVIYESYQDIKDADHKKNRESGLAKLTHLEKVALGLLR